MTIKIFLSAVLFLFLFTRLYNITEIPVSLYWDEASIAYNAFSILQTGKDEWGEFLPLHFRAFGEFKLPVYIYTVAVFEKIFGLSEISVRLPAVFFSLGSIIFTYLLALKISNKKSIALFSSFFLAVSPWFFIFSRAGYESTAGLMFFILGTYLLFFKKPWFLIAATISFVLSVYGYNSFRVITPLVLIISVICYIYDSLVYHTQSISKRLLFAVCLSLAILVISFIPIIKQIKSNDGINRWQTISIFSDKSGGNIFIKFAGNYLSHFNPQFLFIYGDTNLRSQQQGFGQLYWVELPLLFGGLIFILTQRNIIYYLPLLMVLLAPLPAAVTRESPHALRVLSGAPFISIISAFGVFFWVEKIRKKLIFNTVVIVIFLAFFFNYFYSFINYYPAISAEHWQYTYKALAGNYHQVFNWYDNVVISDYYGQPYIFMLYYLKYDPIKFRSEVEYNSLDRWGNSTVAGFNNFFFRQVNENSLPGGKSIVFAAPTEKLVNLKEEDLIKNLDGSIAFYVYEIEK